MTTKFGAARDIIVSGKLGMGVSSTADVTVKNDSVLMKPLDVAMGVWNFESLHAIGWLPRQPSDSSEPLR